MKTLLISAVIFATTFSINTSAALKSANNLKFVGDTQYAELCQAAATNDLALFKKNVKQHGFWLNASKRKMLTLLANENNFKCAGQGLVEFSKARGSQDITDFITGESSSVEASSSKYKFVGDRGFKNFCKAAVTNNVDLFKRALSRKVGSLGLSQKEVLDRVLEDDNVTCAGENLADFFQNREATSVMSYITENVGQ